LKMNHISPSPSPLYSDIYLDQSSSQPKTKTQTKIDIYFSPIPSSSAPTFQITLTQTTLDSYFLPITYCYLSSSSSPITIPSLPPLSLLSNQEELPAVEAIYDENEEVEIVQEEDFEREFFVIRAVAFSYRRLLPNEKEEVEELLRQPRYIRAYFALLRQHPQFEHEIL
jgi:hypothetical protein